MENGCSGESKTGARPLVATSFPYIRDGERGKGQLYQETLDLVSSRYVERGEMVDGMDLVSGL